jgi:NAD(P)-dependent dehydrogenase (short-subunit alcohol dehydrogenase family)
MGYFSNSYFAKKTVYITGAASGIGFETARQLIQQGTNLVLFDVQALDTALTALQSINANNVSISTYKLDVTDAEATTQQFDLAASIAPPDILMHFVGITGPWTFDDMSQEQFERVININLFGTRNVLAAIRPFLSRGKQVMVTASMASFTGSYGYSSYSASKFAIWGMMQSINFEWQPLGIDITVFAPPPIDTPLTQAEVGIMSQAGVGMKKLAGELKIEDAVKSMLKGVENREFLVVPGIMANIIRLQLRLFPISWVNWIGNKTVAFSLKK